MKISANHQDLFVSEKKSVEPGARPKSREVSATQTPPEPSDRVQLSSSKGSATKPPTGGDEPRVTRKEIPGSFIAVMPSEGVLSLASHPTVQVEKILGEANGSTFVLIRQPEMSLDSLQNKGPFTQVFPNYEYHGDIFDEPVASGQPVMTAAAPSGRPGHLDIINVDPAWNITKGSPTVISAITDTGLDVAHPVLAGTVWQNPNEVLDGQDNDGNGYVDDVAGWDFTDNDNDPSDTYSTHHTHVHGIVHAREGDSGATGVAPGAVSMPLRISGGRRSYSSAMVAESYLYALKQGAKSINTSFNIDGFVGDKALEMTYRTLSDNDVLIFNSAGNGSTRNSPRTKFEDIILVASTDTSTERVDQRSSFSNWGHGVDISAPGRDIMSTLPNNRVGTSSGTSMATPVAMGVDALVRSAHPDWTAAQRWAQIAGTADNIDQRNPKEAGEMGFGRVNAGRALTEKLTPPTLSARETKDAQGSTTGITVRFEKVFDPASANREEAWQVRNSEGTVVMKGAPREIRLHTNEINFDVSSLPAGSYELVGSAKHLVDPFGQPLDGNQDGIAGDDFVKEFVVLKRPASEG
jgi:hypothetical protein